MNPRLSYAPVALATIPGLSSVKLCRMRLAFVTPGFSAAEGDWCIPVFLDLVRTFARDDDVTIFTLRYPHHRRPYEVHGARVIPLGGAQVRGFGRLPLFVRALAEILRRSRSNRFDVIHAFWAHEPGFLAALAGRLTKTPVVVSLLGGELVDLPDIGYGVGQSAVNRFLVRVALARADRVIVGSEYQRRLAAPRVAADRLVVATLGVETERFRPGPISPGAAQLDGDPALLTVASLCGVKDHATLLDAFAAVARRFPGARLHLVGDGELRGTLERRAAEPDLASRVRFHGAVPHELLPDLYRQADLCVLSSRSEGSAMAVLEAVACGCPTVGTAVGLLPDLGDASRTAPPGDPTALGELLADLLADRPALTAMARASLDRVRDEYSLERCVARLRDLYSQTHIRD